MLQLLSPLYVKQYVEQARKPASCTSFDTQPTEWQTVKSRATSVARNIASVWVSKSTRFLVTYESLLHYVLFLEVKERAPG